MQIKNLLKKNAVLFAALCITVATSAFKANTVFNDTYSYSGPDFSTGEFTDPSNWSRVTTPTAENCEQLVQDVTCTMSLPSGYNSGNLLDGAKVNISPAGSSGLHTVASVQDISNPSDPQNIEFSQTRGELP